MGGGARWFDANLPVASGYTAISPDPIREQELPQEAEYIAPSAVVMSSAIPSSAEHEPAHPFENSMLLFADNIEGDAVSSSMRTRGTLMEVEEISDMTQQAEFWLSLNQRERALEILERQTHTDQIDSPAPWLYLLDLYRESKEKAKFNELRARFTQIFNAYIPEFEADMALESHRDLEEFPHLIAQICELWHTADIMPFLQDLLIDERDGARAGFDLNVYREIMMLIGMAELLAYPKLAA